MFNIFKKQKPADKITFIDRISKDSYDQLSDQIYIKLGMQDEVEDINKYFCFENFNITRINNYTPNHQLLNSTISHAKHILYHFKKTLKWNTIITPKDTYDSLIFANAFKDIAFVSAYNYRLDYEVHMTIYPDSLKIFVKDNNFSDVYSFTEEEIRSEAIRIANKIYPDIGPLYFSIYFKETLDKN